MPQKSNTYAPRWMFAKKRSFDGRHGWLADFAPDDVTIFPSYLHDLGKRLELLELNDLKQFSARVLEMMANVVLHGDAHRFHLGLEDLGYLRNASATSLT
ncbi:hypothetical protein BC938DRAFT_475707 [Jimgerdemannia flammicorona]|uniref:Uncharacterized protein n=1 Tax=Jimgerdemannia flammicorona TaxID=994334 RepID=A0A433QZB0_9FUNG|nr:hypothetical protein BC938DRAFT_475707 [Jimgerdemannia flammicorona]